MKHKQNLIKFLMKDIYIYVSLFNLRHVIHTPSLRMVSLLCYESHFSNIKLIDAKTKYRSPYHLDVF